MAAEKTSVVSAAETPVVSAAKKAATTSAATSDISVPSTTPWAWWGRRRRPRQGVVDSIEMSDVAADVAAVAAFFAADTIDVLAADTTDVLSAANAADGGFCPANNLALACQGHVKNMVLRLIRPAMATNRVKTGPSGAQSHFLKQRGRRPSIGGRRPT